MTKKLLGLLRQLQASSMVGVRSNRRTFFDIGLDEPNSRLTTQATAGGLGSLDREIGERCSCVVLAIC